MFWKTFAIESANRRKHKCKVFRVKLVFWLIVAQKGTNILIFCIFEYGAEYGAECSAESDAKYYFMQKCLLPRKLT